MRSIAYQRLAGAIVCMMMTMPDALPGVLQAQRNDSARNGIFIQQGPTEQDLIPAVNVRLPDSLDTSKYLLLAEILHLHSQIGMLPGLL